MKNKEVGKVELGINDCIDEPILMTNDIEKKKYKNMSYHTGCSKYVLQGVCDYTG